MAMLYICGIRTIVASADFEKYYGIRTIVYGSFQSNILITYGADTIRTMVSEPHRKIVQAWCHAVSGGFQTCHLSLYW